MRVKLTLTLCALPPRTSVIEPGLTLPMAMLGLIVKVRAFDVPPPGEGFTTVTEAVPAVAMSLAGTEAVNWVLLE